MRLLRKEIHENVRDEGAVEALAAALAWHNRARANSVPGSTVQTALPPQVRRSSYQSLPSMRQQGRRLLEECQKQILEAESHKDAEQPVEGEDAEDSHALGFSINTL